MKYLGVEPKVMIDPKIKEKMFAYVENSDKAIGWVGYVSILGNGGYMIDDIFLIKQKVSFSDVSFEKESLDIFINENEKDLLGGFFMIGKSKVNASSDFTVSDDKFYEELFKNKPFYIAIQINKKKEINVCFINREHKVKFDKLNLEVKFKNTIQKDIVLDEIHKNTIYDNAIYNIPSYSDTKTYSNYANLDSNTSNYSGSSYTIPPYTPYKKGAIVNNISSELVTKNPDLKLIV